MTDSKQIIDAKVDYYGKTIAICHINGTVTLYNIERQCIASFNSKLYVYVQVILDHKGPALCCNWGHPRFTTYLASGGSDGVMYLYSKQDKHSQWQTSQEFASLNEAITGVSFGPERFGLNIACVTSKAMVYSFDDSNQGWNKISFPEISKVRLNSVSWSHSKAQTLNALLVIGGEDGAIHILELLSDQLSGRILSKLQYHSAPILSVEWSIQGNILSCDKHSCLLFENANQYNSNMKPRIIAQNSVDQFFSAAFNSLGNTISVVCAKGNMVYRCNVLGDWIDVITA